jgi:cytochrome d ubiquinol oxidase subunit II
MLGATAAGLYPDLLISTLDPRFDLTIHNAAAGGIGLRIGLTWWVLAIALAIGYFVYLFHSFRGKVTLENEGYGH